MPKIEVFDPKYSENKDITCKGLYLIAATFIGWHVIGSIPHGYDRIKTTSEEQAKFSGPDDPRWLKIYYITEDESIVDAFVTKLENRGFTDIEIIDGPRYTKIVVDLRKFKYEEDSIIEDLNESKTKYPAEIRGSGYSIRDDDSGSFSNHDQLKAKALKSGEIIYSFVSNYMKPAGTPWVRCLNQDDALKLIKTRFSSYKTLVPHKNSNEQILKFIGMEGDIPIYVCTGEYRNTEYYLDKTTGKIKKSSESDEKYKNIAHMASDKHRQSEDSLKKWIIYQAWFNSRHSVWESFYDEQINSYIDQLRIKEQNYSYVINYELIETRKGFSLAVSPNIRIEKPTNISAEGIEKLPNISSVTDYDWDKCINVSLHMSNYPVDNDYLFDNISISDNISEKEVNDIINKVAERVSSYFDDAKEKIIKEANNNTTNTIYSISKLDNDLYIEDYKWLFDTIRVYVIDTYSGSNWTQELDLINNNISETIKAYKKQLGKGYWIDYIGPGKMHRNTALAEDMSSKKIYSDSNIDAYILTTNCEEDSEFLKNHNIEAPIDKLEKFYTAHGFSYFFIDKRDGTGYLIEIEDNKQLSQLILLPTFKHIDNSIAYTLISEPSLYKFLEKNDINNTSFGDNDIEIASNFLNKFKEDDYKKALWMISEYLRLDNDTDPWGYEQEEIESLVIDTITNQPNVFIDTLLDQISDLKTDKANKDLIELAEKIKEAAFELLDPEAIIEKLN